MQAMKSLAGAVALALVTPMSALAVEGMWQPAQVPTIAKAMQAEGLAIDPQQLGQLTGQPMGAIVSIPGCSASFISPQGLIATNHHCAYGTIQYNSTAEHNLLETGFSAAALGDELPADPTARVWVTESIDDVSAKINAAVKPSQHGRARYDAIDAAKKALVKDCEKPGLHCEVYTFHGGLSYQLVRQREIRDVRLVYAPPQSIGKFGGEVDNWMWPRHTGDFSLLRAYVAKDGSSAAFSKDNVPFQPKHFLPLNAQGVSAGDFVMVAGYPGRTNRYRLAEELSDNVGWSYPTLLADYREMMAMMRDAGDRDPAVKVKYVSTLSSLANVEKNYVGQLEGLGRSHAQELKDAQAAELDQWLAAQGDKQAGARKAVADLRALIASGRTTRDRDLLLMVSNRVGLLNSGRLIYRNAIEQAKPDAQRKSGFQQRDRDENLATLTQIERRVDPATDARLMRWLVDKFVALPPAQHLKSLDQWLGDGVTDLAVRQQKIDALYKGTRLFDTATRLALFDTSRAELDRSDDTGIRLAAALSEERLAIEAVADESNGREAELRPAYMRAIIDWKAARNEPVYPDANSSLRITYGRVQGYRRDGADYAPFTTAEGILQKSTSTWPFNTPERSLARIRAGDFGAYAFNPVTAGAVTSRVDRDVASVPSATDATRLPVNFMGDLDIVGGNSGSAVLDAHGRLVGLAFDGNWESISDSWLFRPETARSIMVDVRYMLWVMDKVDHNERLLKELAL